MVRYPHMKLYETKQFSLPQIEGLSEKQIAVHLKLYEGYVTHVNTIHEQIKNLKENNASPYVINELRRRYAFEFDGMRLHEYYFEQFEGGSTPLGEKLSTLVSEKYGSSDNFIAHIKEVAGSRGIGWVIVSYDERGDTVHTTWVSDHELGHLSGTHILCAIDMWEHAFMVDYVPAEKPSYLDAVLAAMNWDVVEKRLP